MFPQCHAVPAVSLRPWPLSVESDRVRAACRGRASCPGACPGHGLWFPGSTQAEWEPPLRWLRPDAPRPAGAEPRSWAWAWPHPCLTVTEFPPGCGAAWPLDTAAPRAGPARLGRASGSGPGRSPEPALSSGPGSRTRRLVNTRSQGRCKNNRKTNSYEHFGNSKVTLGKENL